MSKLVFVTAFAALLFLSLSAGAQGSPDAARPVYEPELARSLGADDHGMRSYVLVILKTGPNRIPAGAEATRCSKANSPT